MREGLPSVERPARAGRALAALALLVLAGGAVVLALGPVAPEELALAKASSLTVEARDGTVLRELVSRDGYATPAQLHLLPPHVWQAFVAAEDKRFFSHPGIDPLALGRAVLVDLRARRFAQGGSTLTQQLSRLLRPRPRTLWGKLGEALFALRLERTLSKRALLEQYLSRVPLGNEVRGVEAAARLYFDRPAAALTVAQAALLAQLSRSPRALDPLRAPERSRAGTERVLARMNACGYLGVEALAQARAAPLDLSHERLLRAFDAPHFVFTAAAQAPREAVVVRTTLDLALQRELEEAVREQVAALADKRVTSAAALVLDNATGEVLAYAGSPDWFDEEHEGRIDGVRTRRQPGSTLKPFAYGAAIERHGFTAATLLSDVESHFATAGGEYVPKNYDRRAHGPVRLRIALASSYNVPAVHVAEKVGAGELLQVLRDAGFRSLGQSSEHYGLGLVLGNGEVSLEELARAYAGLARGGVIEPLVYLRSAADSTGRSIALAHEPSSRLFTSTTAALLGDILSDAGARAPAFGLDNSLRFPFPVAAKTGTSRAFTDNWTAGFTRERTVAVWVGNMSGETMRHVSGITGAGPLFHRAMLLAMRGLSERPAPLFTDASLEPREICALSGKLAGSHCPSHAREIFAPGTAPRESCDMHSARGVDLGPRFYDWAAHEGVATRTDARSGGARAELAFPHQGDEFLCGSDLAGEYQTIPVRAVAPKGEVALELQLDSGPREKLAAPFSTRVVAQPGKHEVRLYRAGAADPDARATFVVKG